MGRARAPAVRTSRLRAATWTTGARLSQGVGLRRLRRCAGRRRVEMSEKTRRPIAVEDVGEVKLAELQAMTGDCGGKLLMKLQRRCGMWVVAFVVPRSPPVEREFVCEDLATAVEDAVVDFIVRHVGEPEAGREARA